MGCGEKQLWHEGVEAVKYEQKYGCLCFGKGTVKQHEQKGMRKAQSYLRSWGKNLERVFVMMDKKYGRDGSLCSYWLGPNGEEKGG